VSNLSGLVRPENFHFSVEAVVQEEVVGHANAVRLHRVALAVVVVPDVACMKQLRMSRLLKYSCC
jgi:hypothetical protein